MRLSYCYPTPERIREGVRRLAGVVEAELDFLRTFGARRGPGRRSRVRRHPRRTPPEPGDNAPVTCPSPASLPGPTRAPRTEPTVAVLAGGLSHEREVSLQSGRRLSEPSEASGWPCGSGIRTPS